MAARLVSGVAISKWRWPLGYLLLAVAMAFLSRTMWGLAEKHCHSAFIVFVSILVSGLCGMESVMAAMIGLFQMVQAS